MNEDGFLANEFPPCAPEDALFHVLPVPWEATVSYVGGTAAGPAAILAASHQLEITDGFSVPGEAGIATLPAIDCTGDRATVYEHITEAVGRTLALGKVPVVLGGEHSLTLPVVAAYARAGRRVGIVQFDAHADLRDSFEGSPWNHASVMRRIHADLCLPVLQLATRAVSLEERAYRKEQSIPFVDARDLVPAGTTRVGFPADFPDTVFVSFDVDGLDPSIMPATGTPVPGGLGWYQTLALLESIAASRTIAGFDIVELAPLPGLVASDFLAAELAHRIMGMIQRARGI